MRGEGGKIAFFRDIVQKKTRFPFCKESCLALKSFPARLPVRFWSTSTRSSPKPILLRCMFAWKFFYTGLRSSVKINHGIHRGPLLQSYHRPLFFSSTYLRGHHILVYNALHHLSPIRPLQSCARTTDLLGSSDNDGQHHLLLPDLRAGHIFLQPEQRTPHDRRLQRPVRLLRLCSRYQIRTATVSQTAT